MALTSRLHYQRWFKIRIKSKYRKWWAQTRLKILSVLMIRAFNQFKLIIMNLRIIHPIPIEFFHNQTVKIIINWLKSLNHKVHKIKILNLMKPRSYWITYRTCVKTWKMKSGIRFKIILNMVTKVTMIYAKIQWT